MKTLNASGIVTLNASLFVIAAGYAMDMQAIAVGAASAWMIMWWMGRFANNDPQQVDDGLTDRQREFKSKFNDNSQDKEYDRQIKITLTSGAFMLIDEDGTVTFEGDIPKDVQETGRVIGEQIKQVGFDAVDAAIGEEFVKMQKEKEK